jgi:hypothetical protein
VNKTEQRRELWRQRIAPQETSGQSIRAYCRGRGLLDLAPDAKRIVALMPVETPDGQQAQSHVIFLMNFFDELQRKMPLGQ